MQIAAIGVLTTATPAASHSLQEVEQQLFKRERYFQSVNQPAPEFTLRDAAGRVHRLRDYRGKVVILNFIYTKCPDVCPLHSEKIAQIQKQTNISPMKDQVAFLTISTDPRNDTPKVMKEFGGQHGLDPANWTFLTTLPSQPIGTTRQLAAAYGLKFTTMPDGMQMHGAVTHLIDQEGRLRARFHSLRFSPVNVTIFANALVNKAHTPHPHGTEALTLWERLKLWFSSWWA
ncbi:MULTISPECIES: SCO family protein [Sphingomonadaceae]|uniref:Protein SCO1/2 n=1 Tax=Sphingobium scionense TaxID=1404341 RepID=A0A7W6Q0E5_9SPHN|nr:MULTISPECIES: SCO family protein [Sphingomonadaceae]MBB4152055.1 protein SCO1/2 [Sphingobium scionense]